MPLPDQYLKRQAKNLAEVLEEVVIGLRAVAAGRRPLAGVRALAVQLEALSNEADQLAAGVPAVAR